MKKFIICALLSACSAAPQSITADTAYPTHPNDAMTPGSMCSPTDPDFKEYRYAEKIAYCNRNVTFETKTALYQAYGIDPSTRKDYTIDHLIPLSMGGNNATTNLWPQNLAIYTGHLEYFTFCRLRDGEITQAVAIKIVLDAKHGLIPIDSITRPTNCAQY